jgi:endonuclease/exonuclease/phosphatase family metal-dependent hydrolase
MNCHPFKFLVWNVRGAANTSFYRNCKQYIDIHHPEIFVIMELRAHPLKIKNSIEMMGFDGYIFSENRGFSGGIAIAWKKSVVDITCIHMDFQFIHTRLVINGRKQFLFTAIYASPVEENRHDMWDKIMNIAVSVHEPWMLAGDFNDIMSQDEKQGGALVNLRRCRVFQERVNKCKLLDLGAVGSKFTWRGPIYENGVHIFERLDRALCNDGWRVQFPNAIVRTLPRVDFSDHHPLLVLLDDMVTINKERPFRFESAWQTHDSFQGDLSSWWRQELNLTANLSKVEDALKEWRINTFGSVRKKKRELLARLGGIQRKREAQAMHCHLRRLERSLQSELAEVLKQEELMWHQRSRARWLYDGDRNTKYYHLKAVNRKRKNKIIEIMMDSGWKKIVHLES